MYLSMSARVILARSIKPLMRKSKKMPASKRINWCVSQSFLNCWRRLTGESPRLSASDVYSGRKTGSVLTLVQRTEKPKVFKSLLFLVTPLPLIFI